MRRSFGSFFGRKERVVPSVKCFFENVTNTAQYILYCPRTKNSVIIDPVLEYEISTGNTGTKSADILLDYVKNEKLNVEYLFETHVHADHITSACYLKQELLRMDQSPRTCISEHITTVQQVFAKKYELEMYCDGSQFDHLLKDEDILSLGDLEIRVMETPGHTPACLSYLVNDYCIFVGDTFFMPDSGTARCDFPGGSARKMWNSLQKILQLDPETKVYLCHDYKASGKRDEYQWETTIGEQLQNNVQLANRNEEEYKKFRSEKDATLGLPKLIHPSLQFNLLGGTPPPFIKMPVSATWKK